MTVAVRTVIIEWGIPHLRVCFIMACAFLNNIGSQRVFLKNGFLICGTLHASDEEDLARRGRKEAIEATLVILEWRKSTGEEFLRNS